MFGRAEWGVQGQWLITGTRVGPFRRHRRWEVSRLKRLVVYVYPEKQVEAAPAECGNLAAEFEDNVPAGKDGAPFVLVSGYSPKEILALAEHFNQRMTAVGKGFVQTRAMPPIKVIETQEAALCPAPENNEMPKRMLRTLPFHLIGAVSLWFLTQAVDKSFDRHMIVIRVLWLAAWILEFLIVMIPLSVWRHGRKKARQDSGRANHGRRP
jgi:hypothetical protein